jgi:hypothetical protein
VSATSNSLGILLLDKCRIIIIIGFFLCVDYAAKKKKEKKNRCQAVFSLLPCFSFNHCPCNSFCVTCIHRAENYSTVFGFAMYIVDRANVV